MSYYNRVKREIVTQVKHIESGIGPEQQSEKIQSKYFTTLEK